MREHQSSVAEDGPLLVQEEQDAPVWLIFNLAVWRPETRLSA